MATLSSEPADTPDRTALHLTANEVDTVRRYLAEAQGARPATVADEVDHYHALMRLSAIVELVFGDAAERGQR
jgi:hypothetical protein